MSKKKVFWLLSAAAIVILLTLAVRLYFHTKQLYYLEACNQNMNYIYHAFRTYADAASQERFPPLSMVPGRLMFDVSTITPDDLHGAECMISRDHPDAEALIQIADTNPAQAIDDHSYWYLGYTILSEPVLESFIEDYRLGIEKGEPVPEIDEIFPESRAAVEERWERHVGEVNEHVSVEPAGGAPSQREPSYDFPIGNEELNARLILRDGIERFLIHDPRDRMAAQRKASEIPVLIERPELHGNGGHVLFLDGHVEFIEYPGKFPMTEAFIEGLRELDALGDD